MGGVICSRVGFSLSFAHSNITSRFPVQSSDFDKLLQGLRNPDLYPQAVSTISVIETHISAVLLTGDFAYKLKKPLDLGFLDFSTLERRKHYCEEEIRLNKRLAPDLYLDTVPITGTPDSPIIAGKGPPIEYLVRMRQFDPEQQLDRLLARGELTTSHIDNVIARIATFHAHAAKLDKDSLLGTPEAVFAPMQQNFDQLYPLITDPTRHAQIERLERWTKDSFERLAPLLAQRRAAGFIRECHGDMHLGNMVQFSNDITIFDGIEFNDAFRWIDIANEIAFFVMDLESRGASALAHRALNGWIELTGDHQAPCLMRFYQTYRAMVRAKVACIRLAQPGLSDTEREDILSAYQRYADLAERYTLAHRGALLITHGFSGAGKTTLSTQAVEALGMIRLRSDVERKRLFGMGSESRSGSGITTGLYTAEATEQTYAALIDHARWALLADFPVVVDASFLGRKQRMRFAELAYSLNVPFLILDVHASESSLRERIGLRENDASEATTAVLDWQMDHADPLEAAEPKIQVDSTQALPMDNLRTCLNL